jgi:radical SAM protein with 4Fe4S-binding SPASM domain
MSSSSTYLRLARGIYLKVLESPCAYNILSDDLYELSPQALEFLSRCDGTKTAAELNPEEGFLADCLEEGVLELMEKPRRRGITVGENEVPSLRYLMVEVTDRCNLRCRHCYLGDAGASDLDWDTARRVLDDFDDIGGLRLMITGGEPLLYPHFGLLNRSLKDRSYRPVLITNGTLMQDINLKDLNFQEVQFSVDGLEEGHDHLRGKGAFRQVMWALRAALNEGIDVSVATVIHSRNLDQLEGLGEMLSEMDVSSWTLEFPVPSGRMDENRELMPRPEDAVPYFELEWGWGVHEGAEGYACGAHLACLEPGGRLVKCGYYRDIGGGHAGHGLRRAWRELPKMRLEGACAECDILGECGGGCRYRAEVLAGAGGPDPVMCARLGKAWR